MRQVEKQIQELLQSGTRKPPRSSFVRKSRDYSPRSGRYHDDDKKNKKKRKNQYGNRMERRMLAQLVRNNQKLLKKMKRDW